MNPGLNSSPRLWADNPRCFWQRPICAAKQGEHTLKSLSASKEALAHARESHQSDSRNCGNGSVFPGGRRPPFARRGSESRDESRRRHPIVGGGGKGTGGIKGTMAFDRKEFGMDSGIPVHQNRRQCGGHYRPSKRPAPVDHHSSLSPSQTGLRLWEATVVAMILESACETGQT